MTTWRFVAHVLDDLESPPKYYPALWDTEKENLRRINSFLDDRKLDVEGQLDWVALEKSAVDAPYHAKWGEWQEVSRLQTFNQNN